MAGECIHAQNKKIPAGTATANIVGIISALATVLQLVVQLNGGKMPKPNLLGMPSFWLSILLMGILIWEWTRVKHMTLFLGVLFVSVLFCVWINITAEPRICPNTDPSSPSFCPLILDDIPLAGNPRPEQNAQLGSAYVIPLNLLTAQQTNSINAVSQSIVAKGGDIVEFGMLIPETAPTNLAITTILKDGDKSLGDYQSTHPKPGQINNISIVIPESVGDIPIQMLLIVEFALKRSSAQGAQSWAGEIVISSSAVNKGGPQRSLTPNPTPTFPIVTNVPPDDPSGTIPIPTGTDTTSSIQQTPAPPGIHESGGSCTPLQIDAESTLVDWWYVVKQGDTLMELALFFYGDGDQWSEIFEANLPVLASEPVLYTGQVLQIPGVTAPLRYTVHEGDSLQSIASNAYGLGADARWCTIYNANSDKIGPNPHQLNMGIIISIYPLIKLATNQIRVLPRETMNDYALAYYHDERRLDWLCTWNGRTSGASCDELQPLDTVTLPDLPPETTHMVVSGETWADIALLCYGTIEGFVPAIQKANRRIVGIDPTWLRVGQKLRLWGCKSR